jgi:biuret amidohydrolase
MPGLEFAKNDIVLWRGNSLTAFHGCSLDSLLRNLGVVNVIITGISLNGGIVGATIEAMNCNYRPIVPTDCVMGYPFEYGEAVIKHTVSGLSYLTTGLKLAEAWGSDWNGL